MPRAFYRLWHAGQKKPRQIHKNFALRENLLFDLFDMLGEAAAHAIDRDLDGMMAET